MFALVGAIAVVVDVVAIVVLSCGLLLVDIDPCFGHVT